ncbi:preprotein translocase subunit SecG [Phenylobacterium aquaticum]|jgi:preprotein translocase subunit SecG|uniref:preprotein translocase subunit SecG n=1 Tax=Phenylobacterium aquaticum TaxID=1763816 RepID=UPI001F5CF0CB|nr:preprotein translocase subunit SecG [Phenylobacterium aquaticum]MCI3135290.1 preprotein translocase subunit SecG [Phenylobacterium aquaticum]
MLLGILLTFHIIVCVALICVVLLQRSEGGALGMGGGPTGLMTARGAGDLLTRTTWILATLFFVLSLTLTFLTGREKSASSVVDRIKIDNLAPSSLNRPPVQPAQSAPAQPTTGPQPLQAPTPTVRNPFTGQAEPAAPAQPKP